MKGNNMEYEWEHEIKDVLGEIADMLPDGFELIGVAVEYTESNEAALIDNLDRVIDTGILEMDLRQDVMGDAIRQYEEAHMPEPTNLRNDE